MRRSEREVKDIEEILEFIAEQDVIRLALNDEDGTYIVPVNYGFEQGDEGLTFYFHGSYEGRKAAALKLAAATGSLITFEIDGRHAPVIADGCDASYRYMSVMGNARVEILETCDKVRALGAIMDNIMPAPEYKFIDNIVDMTMICKLVVVNFTCKKN